MRLFGKVSAALSTGIALFALSTPASALIISYDELVTGTIPATGQSPWLTANITNSAGGGVDIRFTTSVLSPEFITQIFFSLNTTTASATDPATQPDLDILSCSGKSPAGTGPWQFCVAFDSSNNALGKWDSGDGSYTLHVNGINESNFVFNTAGYISVAHVQGIQPNCSGWIGDYNGTGSKPPTTTDSCGTTTVPEPGTLGLLGLGLAAVGLGLGRRRLV